MAGIAAALGKSVLEFLDPRRKRSDHLLLVGKLSKQVLDENDYGIGALFVDS